MRIIPVPLPRRSLVSGCILAPDPLARDTFSWFPTMASLLRIQRHTASRYNPRSQWRDRCGFTPHSLPRKLGYHLSFITGGRDCQGGHRFCQRKAVGKPSLVVLQDIKEGDSPVRAGKLMSDT